MQCIAPNFLDSMCSHLLVYTLFFILIFYPEVSTRRKLKNIM
jgi:hypothetical protein